MEFGACAYRRVKGKNSLHFLDSSGDLRSRITHLNLVLHCGHGFGIEIRTYRRKHCASVCGYAVPFYRLKPLGDAVV